MSVALEFDVISLFPELITRFCDASLIGSARRDGLLRIDASDPRDFASGPHRSVDDSPYGGGDGMVLRCEPVVAAVEAVARPDSRIVALSPRGRVFDQAAAQALAQESHIVLLCGRYAGFDQRVLAETGAEELSIGDYVIAGGEAAALVVIEAVTRLVPGVVGNPVSPAEDSFAEGLLEHPVYTRPREFRGRTVPDVLLSGDHAKIERYRRDASLRLTRERRPELLDETKLSEEDRAALRATPGDRDDATD